MLVKRFHVHLAVADLAESIKFYSTFFDAAPTVEKEDYAKWMVEDPCLNFAISTRGKQPGLDHLGIQVDDSESLKVISARLKAAEQPILEQEQTTCCYAKADKTWVHDPQSIAWESFYTTASATTYGEDENFSGSANSACCAPMPESAPASIKVTIGKSKQE
jgi:catechol 2,3-dioxygenase-like lactoylglutathione lyase family enzyme